MQRNDDINILAASCAHELSFLPRGSKGLYAEELLGGFGPAKGDTIASVAIVSWEAFPSSSALQPLCA